MWKWKLRIIAAVVIIAIITIIITVVGMSKDVIVKQYYMLSNRPENSAKQFKVPFGYITVNSDGTINIEFATSVKTISNDINVDDDSTDTASGDDDRQNGDGNGNGNGNGPVTKPPDPIDGDTLVFPSMGEELWYRVITTDEEGFRKRVGPDSKTWEFAFDYISTTNNSDYRRMKRRANDIAPYIVNGNTHDALIVNLGNEQMYVGALPIEGFGVVGDIVEFTFDNGNSIRVLGIDAKAKYDNSEKVTDSSLCNTQYSHGVLSGNDIKISAIELWCAGDRTDHGNSSTLPKGNVVQAKIVGHWDGFTE